MAAIPLVPQVMGLVRKKPSRYALVEDVDEACLLDEEIMATVSKSTGPDYGAM